MNDDRYRKLDRGQRAAELAERERGLQNLTDFDSRQIPVPRPIPDESDDGLSQKQRLVIGHLVDGQSITSTAAAIGVSRQTIYNWKTDPHFARAFARQSKEAIDAIAARSRGILQQAARRLERAAQNGLSFDEAIRLMRCPRIWDIAMLTPAHGENAERNDDDAVRKEDNGRERNKA